MPLSFLPLVFAVILVSMLVMSFFYNWLDARAATWDSLARFYETETEPDSWSFVHTTFVMNERCYRGIATIGAGRKGLYLALAQSHQFLHPPLLIPWSDVEAMTAQTNARCAFRIKATATTLQMGNITAQEIRKFVPGDGPPARATCCVAVVR
jgi:hypothetical protein